MRKNNLNNIPLIPDGDMSGSLTSPAIDIRWFDNLIMYISFTGTPTGTFAVETSGDQVTWFDLTLSPVPAAAGAANTIRIQFTQLGDSYIRLKYNRTSGTGTLKATLAGKEI
jgi:hypothetical protein